MEQIEVRRCGSCKYKDFPNMSTPCSQCEGLTKWEPAMQQEITYRGVDMGSPEGGLGVTAIIRETVDAVDENWRITKYAVAGIRAELAALGLRLTDKDMPREEYWHCMDRLYTLTRDLSEYEERLEKIEKAAKAGQVPKP